MALPLAPLLEPFGDPTAPLYRATVGEVTCCQRGHLLDVEAAHHLGDVVCALLMTQTGAATPEPGAVPGGE
jgi:hypothetical protein